MQPESFFNRLFRNKYEQDPIAVQTARGVNILRDGNMSQLQFLHDFALFLVVSACIVAISALFVVFYWLLV